MTITSKEIHDMGFRFSWINKHFKHLALDYCFLSGCAQYNIFNVEQILIEISKYKTSCKNPTQVAKSYAMMDKLKKALHARNV